MKRINQKTGLVPGFFIALTGKPGWIMLKSTTRQEGQLKDVLAFDADGVIIDFFTPYLRHISAAIGRECAYQDCHHHDLAVSFGIDMDTMLEILEKFEVTENIASLPAVPEALDALQALRARYHIAVITSRKAKLEPGTRLWFERNMPDVQIYYGLGRNNPYSGITDRLPKGEIAERIHALCLVEDNHYEFDDWQHIDVQPICFPQPWNACLVQTHPLIPHLDWEGITRRFL
jgi:hypothetical protein